ncbi:hypothetical protein E1B28_003085 [Marasmius oreades]|uniref:Uncharacterized protein n=1 Tax=Marasmius oreades TaxID=181124 RepID=A0A9P7RK73_9AGAR|nr:uncharacterized protein E1B28_003085 [Marasmius oreades]KAG7085526.1 hypothetical protein E1B28_003085 [Marasmius oreades]
MYSTRSFERTLTDAGGPPNTAPRLIPRLLNVSASHILFISPPRSDTLPRFEKMSFSLPLQALANFQLVISVPGEHPVPPTFELKPLPHNALTSDTPMFPTSLQVRARETGQGLTFELTGDHSFNGQFMSPLPTPPESHLGSPSQTLLQSMGLENDYFGADLSGSFPAWSHFNDLPDDTHASALLCSSLSTETVDLATRTLPVSDFILNHHLPFPDPPFNNLPTGKPFPTKDNTASPDDFTSPFTFPTYSPLSHNLLTPIDSGTPNPTEFPETPLPSPESSNSPSPRSSTAPGTGGPARPTRSLKQLNQVGHVLSHADSQAVNECSQATTHAKLTC